MKPVKWKLRPLLILCSIIFLFIFGTIFVFKISGRVDVNVNNVISEGEGVRADALVDQVETNEIERTKEVRPVPWFTKGQPGNFEPEQSTIWRTGVFPPANGMTHTKDKGYGINMTASDLLSMERLIPDTRLEECKYWNYPEKMGLTTSVVIAFHNEGFSTLMRTVHTIFKRTPPELLKEVILVDDDSELENLMSPLEEYIERWNGQVRLLRNKEREGLIRTRTLGAKAAKGDVVVFLDAHCEVNRNWLPPLLAPIYRDRTVLTVPIIDGISFQNFDYKSIYGYSGSPRGIFEWGMLYKEMDMLPQEEMKRQRKSEPYPAPTHAGGLFAIDRKYFFELGAYDPGLEIWGGENFELSFKVWQCGGSLEWVPCSRIGHVYRGAPFTFGSLKPNSKKSTSSNYKRVIEVWFDDKYKEFYYTRDPLARYLDHGDISEQLAMKKRLKCKSFAWFMENVAPDLLTKFPELPPNIFWGELRNKGSGNCIDTLGNNPVAPVGLYGCHGTGSNQLLRLNAAGQLGVGERCLDIVSGQMSIAYCTEGTVDGPWTYDEVTSTLKHKKLEQCLGVDENTIKLTVMSCDMDTPSKWQQWTWKKIIPKRKKKTGL